MDMSQYIVSARKYRPDSFGTLIGQDNIAQTLKNSILRGQLAHAYLFCEDDQLLQPVSGYGAVRHL